MTPDLKSLRAIAEAALSASEKYAKYHGPYLETEARLGAEMDIAFQRLQEAFSPAIGLALLDRLEAAERVISEARGFAMIPKTNIHVRKALAAYDAARGEGEK